MNIFLAGKMDREHGRWRDALLGLDICIFDRRDSAVVRDRSRWILTYPGDPWDQYAKQPPPWPTAPNRWVLGHHHYVGPYRLEPQAPFYPCCPEHEHKSMGCFHGATWSGQHGLMDGTAADYLVAMNRLAIARADLVFAYLNTADCFGTLVDIGYALGLGKFVFVGAADEMALGNWPDYVALVASATPENRDFFPSESDRLRNWLQAAIVEWTATRLDASSSRASSPEIMRSFANIAKWTSDPRVRAEAQRMAKALDR